MDQRAWTRKEDMTRMYRANIDITVNGKKFWAGEAIRESLSSGDADFLLREKYIEEISNPKTAKHETTSAKPDAAGKKKDGVPEQTAEKEKNPRK